MEAIKYDNITHVQATYVDCICWHTEYMQDHYFVWEQIVCRQNNDSIDVYIEGNSL